MSTLEKIIYVADLIEPARNFPGIDQLRDKALCSLDEAMQESIIHTMGYLASKRVKIHPNTLYCYNEFV